jgi:RimJ/RimL family protein N-acetyltransferase
MTGCGIPSTPREKTATARRGGGSGTAGAITPGSTWPRPAARIELEGVAGNTRAINCYLACGFRREGVRREAELYQT